MILSLLAFAMLATQTSATTAQEAATPLPPATGSSAHTLVFIQPLGSALPDADAELVATALREFYGMEVKVLPRVELPAEAWYAPRQRWRAEKLLEFLRPLLPPEGTYILGLTRGDISTTKDQYPDWGVMGLGDLDGSTSVISSFRCHKKSTGELNARQRLAKTAVHEMGHNLGLDHCPNDGCLMHDDLGKVTLTDGEYDLCPRCRGILRAKFRILPPSPAIPWPEP